MFTVRERFQGCLLGLAVGDAVGAAVEFQPPGTFPPVTSLTGGGPFGLQPGQWTDDTSMALCLAESLLVRNGFDPIDQLERYCRWYRQGLYSSKGYCFDIGGATREALEKFERTREPYPGSTHPRSAGNGSLMRLAPVALFYAAVGEDAIEKCGESSRTTHGAAACIDACRYFGALLVAAVQGAGKREILSSSHVPSGLVPEIAEIAAGSYARKQPPEIVGSGYVVKSLEAALWAFAGSENYRDGCLLAANLGDDADTTCAIFGQIAGAHYGVEGIPQEWREPITERDLILGMADQLDARSGL